MIQEETAAGKTHGIHRIPAENLPALQQRIEALRKRAGKLGCQPVELQVSEPIKVAVPVRDPLFPDGSPMRDHDGKVITQTRIYHDVEVKGETPKYAGWTLAAALTYLAADGDNEAAMILRIVPGQTLPDSWRRADQKCDHCGLARKRNETFVVRHEDGTLKQIGRQCIADFLGHQDPESLLAAAEYLLSADGMVCGAEDEGSFGGGKVGVVWLEEYLSWVAVVVRTEGWLSRSKARDQGGFATADRAFDLMTKIEAYRKRDDPRPAAEDLALSKTAIEWARKDLAAKPEKNDYEHNLSVVCTRDAVDIKAFGIAASLISAYKRAMGFEAERKARIEREAKSEFFGEIGKRSVFTLTVLKVLDLESDYGAVHLHRFVDEKGNIATWFSSSGSLAIGKTYQIRGTVKKHEEYKDIKQTMLTRCSIETEWNCPLRHYNEDGIICGASTGETTTCGIAKGSWSCLECHEINVPEAKHCKCGHNLKSWRCNKCYQYNVQKAKTCQRTGQGLNAAVVCGAPKNAWVCRSYGCGKAHEPKVEICECGTDKHGIVRTPATPGA